MAQIFNFSSGPAMLPAEVLKQAQQELRDWNGLGTSVMEVSPVSYTHLTLPTKA